MTEQVAVLAVDPDTGFRLEGRTGHEQELVTLTYFRDGSGPLAEDGAVHGTAEGGGRFRRKRRWCPALHVD